MQSNFKSFIYKLGHIVKIACLSNIFRSRLMDSISHSFPPLRPFKTIRLPHYHQTGCSSPLANSYVECHTFKQNQLMIVFVFCNHYSCHNIIEHTVLLVYLVGLFSLLYLAVHLIAWLLFWCCSYPTIYLELQKLFAFINQ